MASIQDRFGMIEASILGEAQARADALLRQAEDRKAAALKQAEDEVLRQLYGKIQDEVADIHTSATRTISRQESQARRELLLKREEITKNVFRQVRMQLLDYTRTPEYAQMVLRLGRRMAQRYPLEGSVVLLRREDYHMAAELDGIFGRKCRIQPDDTIRIGGLKLMNQSAGIFVDETLDSRLEDQKPYFCSHSGLTVL